MLLFLKIKINIITIKYKKLYEYIFIYLSYKKCISYFYGELYITLRFFSENIYIIKDKYIKIIIAIKLN